MLCNFKQARRARNRKEAEISRRSVSIAYHLKVGRDRVRVCQIMFLHTLCTGEWSVRNWLKNNRKSGADVLENNSRNENDAAHISKRKCEKKLRSLKEFFDQIPKMESHYCRASTMKLYLEPLWKSKSVLYEFYKSDSCSKNSLNYVSKTAFKQLFKKNNFSLFAPKKDACDICAGFKTNNIDEVT
jgi:hypothetical protein